MTPSLLHSPLVLFVTQAILIIAVARTVGVLARRVGQPMVIAEVTAGILLGPSLLGWLAPTLYANLFPAQSMPALQIFSQVGLLLFMFLIGLELDPKLLRGRGRTSLLIGKAGIVVPFVLGSLLALYLYPRVSEPATRQLSFVLFMGTAMSITAFPVLARILSERRLLRSNVGIVAITSAAIADVAAWCLLAFVISVVRGQSHYGPLRTLVLTAVFIAVMVLVVRPFLRRLGEQASSREGLTQNMVAVTFLLLLLSSWATELIGIHALFGAFLFGVLLPKEGSFATSLADKLEDLVVVLLLPIFFAYSGLRTQLGLLWAPQSLMLCLLIVAVACVGKFGGVILAARSTGLSWRESSALGVLMNTRGLMELIVLNLGLDLGVISPMVFTMMVVMALLTTVLTTPLLCWIYPHDPQQRDVLGSLEKDKPDSPQGAFCVLLCVSYTGAAQSLITVANALTVNSSPAPRLYALQLLRPTERTSYYVDAAQAEKPLRSALTPMLDLAQQQGLAIKPISFVSSEPALDICNVAEVKGTDLILLGWHRPLLNQAALGGTVSRVLAEASTAVGVLVDRGLVLGQVRKVLVPFHGTADDDAALALAFRLARQPQVQVTVLQVAAPPSPKPPASDAKAKPPQTIAVPPELLAQVTIKPVVHKDPAEAALAETTVNSVGGYDLVLVGIGSDWGLQQRTFGMSQELFIRRCPASLLIVRGAATAPQSAAQSHPAVSPASA